MGSTSAALTLQAMRQRRANLQRCFRRTFEQSVPTLSAFAPPTNLQPHIVLYLYHYLQRGVHNTLYLEIISCAEQSVATGGSDIGCMSQQKTLTQCSVLEAKFAVPKRRSIVFFAILVPTSSWGTQQCCNMAIWMCICNLRCSIFLQRKFSASSYPWSRGSVVRITLSVDIAAMYGSSPPLGTVEIHWKW